MEWVTKKWDGSIPRGWGRTYYEARCGRSYVRVMKTGNGIYEAAVSSTGKGSTWRPLNLRTKGTWPTYRSLAAAKAAAGSYCRR